MRQKRLGQAGCVCSSWQWGSRDCRQAALPGGNAETWKCTPRILCSGAHGAVAHPCKRKGAWGQPVALGTVTALCFEPAVPAGGPKDASKEGAFLFDYGRAKVNPNQRRGASGAGGRGG